jgi:vesicle coat complex subunit
MQTEDIEQKKLVYLYVVDYAKNSARLSHSRRQYVRQRFR